MQIKKFRLEKLNLSAAKLGTLLDPVRQESTITSWERGRTEPNGDTLIQLCLIFGVDIHDFYYNAPTSSQQTLHSTSLEQSNLLEKNTLRIDQEFKYAPVYEEIFSTHKIAGKSPEMVFNLPKELAIKYPHSGFLLVKEDGYSKTIPAGYLALIDFSPAGLSENQPFAVCVGKKPAIIRGVKCSTSGFELIPHSHNDAHHPSFHDYHENKIEQLTIIGKVVWAIAPLDYRF